VKKNWNSFRLINRKCLWIATLTFQGHVTHVTSSNDKFMHTACTFTK